MGNIEKLDLEFRGFTASARPVSTYANCDNNFQI